MLIYMRVYTYAYIHTRVFNSCTTCTQQLQKTYCNTLQHTATTHCSTVATNVLNSCNILQHTTPYCSTPQHTTAHEKPTFSHGHGNSIEPMIPTYAATHCNTQQHTATHCYNTPQHTRNQWLVCCSVLQCVAVCCSVWQCVLQCVAVCGSVWLVCCGVSSHGHEWQFNGVDTNSHCNTLQHTVTHCNTLQHTATHCQILLQHTTTHRNTPET